jgi:hypothetical protein
MAVTAASPTLGVSAMSVIARGTVTVTITNGPGGIADWVGLYSTTAWDLTFVDWQYLNGTTTAPLIFTMPASRWHRERQHRVPHKRSIHGVTSNPLLTLRRVNPSFAKRRNS